MEEETNFEKDKKSEEKQTLTEKVRGNPWVASTVVLGVLFLVFLLSSFGLTGNITGGTIGVSENDVADSLNKFLDKNTNGDAKILQIEKYNDYLYKATIDLQGQEIPLYITKDGKYLVQGLTSLEPETSASSTSAPADIPKSDKPVVELFVMTHCPYGTQAEKGILPVIKALKNFANIKIKFVHYFMHQPEEEETPRQVCIREEQPDKWLDYLECFLEDGDSNRCLTKAKIDKTKLNTCVSENADKYYDADSELSQNYEVQGSPTLIINGEIVNSARDSQSYLDTICSAFNNAPDACNTELSSTSPSPGFGWTETGSSTSAQC